LTLLPLPEPYDFELSTERYRVFGPDLANLWYEGGLHRVVDGREIRIEAAPGGVDVEPLDEETEPVALELLGAEFELAPFYAWATSDGVLGELVSRLAGLRPPLAPDPLPRSRRSRSRSSPPSRSATGSSSASASEPCVPTPFHRGSGSPRCARRS
jgi:hypothetical protein